MKSAQIEKPASGNERPRLPSSEEARRILAARAAVLARVDTSASATDEQEMYVRIRLGKTGWYGVPVRCVDEVLCRARVTRVPGAPERIAGVVNRRGELLTVVALGRFFAADTGTSDGRANIVVVSAAEMTTGLLVDGLDGFAAFRPVDLTPAPPSQGAVGGAHVIGIHEGKVALLDVESLLADSELIVNHSGRCSAPPKKSRGPGPERDGH